MWVQALVPAPPPVSLLGRRDLGALAHPRCAGPTPVVLAWLNPVSLGRKEGGVFWTSTPH